jgi:predicted anti-sigma-YlaC factor YlaD
MTCRECAEFLSDYLEGDLAIEIRQVFDRHLSLCPNCVTYLEQFRATVLAEQAAFGDDAEPDVPEELIQAILASRRA